MKKFLMMLKHNAGLKILAFIFAVGLWLYVLNVEDPEITRSFIVEVTFENEDELTNIDKNYEVLNDSDTIRVTVSAQRSVIEELSASDFNAVVDLGDLTSSQMDGEQELEVYVSLNRYSGKTTIVSDTRYTTINIEDELTKEISLSYALSGSPANGYAVGSVKLLPDSVEISGVTSQVELVESASVIVDISGMEDDITLSGDVYYYDESGNLIDTSDMTVVSSVSVYVDCEAVKTLELVFSSYGTPSSGYRAGEITSSISEITVQGETDALESLETLPIRVDVSDAQEDVTVSLDAAEQLPYGISIYEDEEVTIEVTVEIIAYSTESIKVSTDDITVSGLSDGLTYAFSSESIYVTISYPAELSDSISSDSIALSADLSDYTAGSYEVTLAAELPDGVYLSSSPSVSVVITGE